MKKILVFTRDPGGTNAVFPLIPKLKRKYTVVVYAKDSAIEIYRQQQIAVEQEVRECDYEKLKKIVQKEHPDLIFTGTSSDDFSERYLWKLGEELDIPTIAILDHWCNYGIRFSRYNEAEQEKYKKSYLHEYIPRLILVMDDYAKTKLIEEKIPGDRVVVTGQPHFEWIKEQYNRYLYNAGSKDNGQINILYVSDNIEAVYGGREEALRVLGYSEKTIFERLINSLERVSDRWGKRVEVKIRQHPKETYHSYDAIIKNERIKITYEERNNIWDFLPEMNIVCGSTSMMLIESYLCGKNVISIQIGDKSEQKFILEEMGKTDVARTDEELDRIFINHSIRENVIECTHFQKNACNNILDIVEKVI